MPLPRRYLPSTRPCGYGASRGRRLANKAFWSIPFPISKALVSSVAARPITRLCNDTSEHRRSSYSIFAEKRCAFIDIPRTASRTLGQHLFDHAAPPHYTYRDIAFAFTRSELRELFIFTIVRNPWGRLASSFRWFQRQKLKFQEGSDLVVTNHLRPFIASIPDTFEEFVISWLTPETMYWDLVTTPQTFWLTARGSQLYTPNFIGRFETLQEDVDTITETLQLPLTSIVDPERLKKACNYHSQYSKRMALKVEKLYRRDINFLDYSFD